MATMTRHSPCNASIVLINIGRTQIVWAHRNELDIAWFHPPRGWIKIGAIHTRPVEVDPSYKVLHFEINYIN